MRIYETAVSCAVNDDLKGEWQKYLDEPRHHVELVQEIFAKIGPDTATETQDLKSMKDAAAVEANRKAE